MNEYYTFAGHAEAFLTEKKSRFISAGAEIFSEVEAGAFLESRRAANKEAGHHVYAYRLPNVDRFSDDREPSGTAGAPVLNLLKSGGMYNTIIVVTRYFGGTLLGTGGLTRAYGHCAKLLFDTGRVIRKTLCRRVSLKIDYAFWGKLQHFIGQCDALVEGTDYAGDVGLKVVLPGCGAEAFLREVADLTNGAAVAEVSEEFFHEYPFFGGV